MNEQPLTPALLERLHELRGWTPEAIERLGVGFDGERVTFPVIDATGDRVGFTHYQPNPDRLNGQPKMKAERGTSRELFPAPETIGDDELDREWLWLLEGPPDCVRAWSLGLVAVAVPSAAIWKTEWTARVGRPHLRVVVCFDCDEAGRAGAARVAEALLAAGVDARVLDLAPDRDDGYDLSDFLAGARTAEQRAEARRILTRCAELATSPNLALTSPKGVTSPPSSSSRKKKGRATSPNVASGEDDRDRRWHPLDLTELGAAPAEPPAIGGLFYLGKRHLVHGLSETGKTWLFLASAIEEMREERSVVWVDGDDVGASDLLERLHAFGVEEDLISRRFLYFQPESALADSDDLVQPLLEGDGRLAVLDGFNALLYLQGLDPDKGVEIEAFLRHVTKPLKDVNAAVLLGDNVVKAKKAGGTWAIGSERKKSGVEVQLGLTLIDPFARGLRGRSRVTVHKDRPGFLVRPSPGLLVLNSDRDTGLCEFRMEKDASIGEEGAFRPTRLMERVSCYLELRTEPVARGQIEEDVQGNRDAIRAGIDRLVVEGYAVEVAGDRGARLYKSSEPFREDAAWEREADE